MVIAVTIIGITGISLLLWFLIKKILKSQKGVLKTKYGPFFESSREALAVLDSRHRFIECNNSFLKLCQIDKDDLLSLTPLDFSPLLQQVGSISLDKADAYFKEAFNKGSCQFHWQQKINERAVNISVILNHTVIDGEDFFLASVRDETEYFKTEEALRLSENRLAQAQKIAHIGHWVWNIQQDTLYWSDEVYRIFGLKPREISPSYERFLSYVIEEDRSMVQNAVRCCLENQINYSIDHRINRDDESERYVHEQGMLTYDREGQPEKMIGTVQDITDRKIVENELELYKEVLEELIEHKTDQLNKAREEISQEKKLSDTLVNSLPGLFFLTDREGKHLRFNHNYERITGYSYDEILDMAFPRILRDEEGFKQMVQDIESTGKASMEADLKNREGKIIPYYFTVSPLEISQQECFIGIASDISELKETTEEVRKLSRVVEQSPSSIMITNTEGDIVFVNPAFSHTTGYSYSEVIGQNPRILKSGKMPEEIFIDLWSEVAKGNIWRREIINRKKSGEYYWVSLVVSPMKGIDGKTTHYLGISEDISERKKYEDELRKAKIEADKASLAKSQFLANMSHEIRTPMNSILGFADILLGMDLKEGEVTGYVEIIKNSASSLLGIINDILDISKLEAGKMDLNLSGVRLPRLIKDVLTILKPQADVKSLTLTEVIPQELDLSLFTDEDKLRQILINIVGNAIKFTPEGYIEVAVEKTSESFLLFSVRDTGIGMTEKQTEHIFSPFAQADQSTARLYGGTGLGTTISKKLITLLGGEIWVISKPGRGSVFYFTLPFRCVPHESETFDMRSSEKGSYRPLRILMAEDVETNRTLASLHLKKKGHDLQLAENGIEAVKAFKSEYFDVVLMDIHMPGMDGFRATEEIRAFEKERGGHTPVIALTASITSEDNKECYRAGMDAVVGKPVEFKTLFRVMDQLTSRETEGDKETVVLDKEALEGRWTDSESWKKALNTFFKVYDSAPREFRTLLKEERKKEAEELADRIIRSAEELYLTEIASLGKFLYGVSQKSLTERGVILNRLQEALYRGKEEFLSLSVENDNDVTALSAQVKVSLRGIYEALGNGEIAEEELKTAYESLPVNKSEELKKKINSFMFHEARLYIDSLLNGEVE